jgi:hypothetical protein
MASKNLPTRNTKVTAALRREINAWNDAVDAKKAAKLERKWAAKLERKRAA